MAKYRILQKTIMSSDSTEDPEIYFIPQIKVLGLFWYGLIRDSNTSFYGLHCGEKSFGYQYGLKSYEEAMSYIDPPKPIRYIIKTKVTWKNY